MRKNETLDDAFVRLVREELGIESGITRADAKFLGVFEHFYDDCVFGSELNTHYVVMAYSVGISKNQIKLEKNMQHLDMRFFNVKNELLDINIHKYTKMYF